MAAKKPETEKLSIEVRGHEMDVDMEYVGSWAALSLMRRLGGGADQFEQLDLSFEFIERATGCDEAAIVEMAGGEDAPAAEVIGFAAEVIQAINPKN